MYLSPAQLQVRLGLQELTRIVGARYVGGVNAEVLEAAINAEILDGYTPALVETAQLALEFINQELASATSVINGYLAANGRYSLPLSQTVIDASPLAGICYDLVRYQLMRAADDQTQRNYDLAMAKLRDISKGVISLGEQDPAGVSTTVHVGRSQSGWDFGGFGR
ncbi:phage protein Gp36 family protein [Bowmanella dokdonensis]|uniref:DUF1320 domain-containing protein n=1 Tax=Bowmanella dokdonensis TaxID=751969 RepID=A0A939INF8_9ALTE|nr:phage protein Gp36 family protein [Bowmanella dokdonensis]MBN7824775.1 DUF1320 domain-containing protein [Bowmanella dokdonensis]